MTWESYASVRRADRIAAAEQDRADRTALAQQRLAAQAAAAADRRTDRVTAAQLAATRRTERRNVRRAFMKSLPDKGLEALWATLIVLPITLAWHAQALFADTIGFHGAWANAFPGAIEVAAWVCVFESARRIHAGGAAGSLRYWTWVLAGFAAAINAAHGLHDGGLPEGLSLAGLSLLGVLLHTIRQGLDRAEHVGGVLAVRRAVWRRVRYPRLSLAAASIRAARELDAATAWRLAWADRYGVGPDTTRRERRLARLIVGQEDKDARTAARNGELSIVDGRVRPGFAPAVKAFVDAERQAAMAVAEQAEQHARAVVQEAQDVLTAAGLLFGPDALRSEQDSSEALNEQAALSPRAAELLPDLHAAISAGLVPANPSVATIRDWVRTGRRERLGVPAAQELRDAVKGLHLVDQPVDVDQVLDDERVAS